MAKSSGGSNHRSAGTGRFVSASTAAANKAGHQAEPRGKSGDSPGSPYRSTKTGQYVTEAYGKSHPKSKRLGGALRGAG